VSCCRCYGLVIVISIVLFVVIFGTLLGPANYPYICSNIQCPVTSLSRDNCFSPGIFPRLNVTSNIIQTESRQLALSLRHGTKLFGEERVDQGLENVVIEAASLRDEVQESVAHFNRLQHVTVDMMLSACQALYPERHPSDRKFDFDNFRATIGNATLAYHTELSTHLLPAIQSLRAALKNAKL
jgi:hypothetical protein